VNKFNGIGINQNKKITDLAKDTKKQKRQIYQLYLSSQSVELL
jgi:hypothetical protein